MSKFSRSAFLTVVDQAPLVSIDLVVIDRQRRILVGRRVNEPAVGSWFVPGGRIWKGETLDEAFVRIASSELGSGPWERELSPLIGTYTHLYQTNFAGVPGIGTHYVVLAHLIDLAMIGAIDELDPPAAQHSEYLWLGHGDDPPDGEVHPNARVYFDRQLGGD